MFRTSLMVLVRSVQWDFDFSMNLGDMWDLEGLVKDILPMRTVLVEWLGTLIDHFLERVIFINIQRLWLVGLLCLLCCLFYTVYCLCSISNVEIILKYNSLRPRGSIGLTDLYIFNILGSTSWKNPVKLYRTFWTRAKTYFIWSYFGMYCHILLASIRMGFNEIYVRRNVM